jgi:tripartite-type tricarboxylate transporter receptor subunit TctC
MKLRRRQFLHLAVGAAALSTVSGIAKAQSYPTRPVRLVVASSPGGVHDVIARLWADQLKGTLGIIVIENRGGAGGTIGVNEVAHAQPDGYTLLLGSNSTHILQPLVGKRPGFDPIKDFDLVTIFAITSTAIAVHPSVPARTLRQLIEAAKAAQGKLSYAHGGVGSISNVAGESSSPVTSTSCRCLTGAWARRKQMLSAGTLRCLSPTSPDKLSDCTRAKKYASSQ